MGDIVHGLPTAAYLKEQLPELELTWLVEQAGAPLLQGNPAVDRVIVFPKRKWLQQLRTVSRLGATAAEAGSFISELRKLEFDAAIDLQGLMKSSLLAFLSNAKLRFGFKGTREGADRLLTHRYACDYFGNQTHVIQHNLALADFAVKVLKKEVSDTESGSTHSFIYNAKFPLPPVPGDRLEKVRNLLAPLKKQKKLVALIPGTTWVTKIWDSDKWVELASLILGKTAGPLLLLGGPAEKEMNSRIAQSLPDHIVDLTGRTDIPDLQAIFQATDFVVGADTGPLHLAAATGIPRVAAIFGATPWHRNGPYGEHCQSISLALECQPCFKKHCLLETNKLECLKDLDSRDVFSQLDLD